MSKYIIDIPDSVKKIVYFHVGNANAIWTTSNILDDLEELNSDYINEHFGQLQDEAYNRGYNRGYKEGEENGRKDGLIEAWECMRAVVKMPYVLRSDVFDPGHTDFMSIIEKYTPQEAIAKLKAYEEEKYRIHVGDEVVSKNSSIKFIVTNIDDETVTMLSSDGQCAITHMIESFKRTGRRFDIQTILKEIGDEN